jgi:two-component system response regulator MprA
VSGRLLLLIVEDDADAREAIVLFLEAAGYSVVAAENGLTAIELLRGGLRPDLIMLDLMMPVMNGSEFRAAQLQDPALRSIPILLLSAHPTLRARAAELGISAYLDKPFDIDDLLQRIKEHEASL